MNKLPPLKKPPVLFTRSSNIQVYFDLIAVESTFGSITSGEGLQMIQAFDRALDEIRALNIFAGITRARTSLDCDIFVTLSQVNVPADVDGYIEDTVGVTMFRRHLTTKKRYAEIRLDEKTKWRYKDNRISWLMYRPRFERWIIHEIFHALGCPHTTGKVSTLPSLMDEENWGYNKPVIPNFDKALIRRIYGIADPYDKFL